MLNLEAMKVRSRLAIGFGLLTGLLFVLATLSIFKLRGLSGEINLIVNDRYEKVELSTNLRGAVNVQARTLRDAVLAVGKNQTEADAAADRAEAAFQKNTQLVEKLDASLHLEKGREIFGKITDARKTYNERRQLLLAQIKAGNQERAAELVNSELTPAEKPLTEALAEMVNYEEGTMRDSGFQAIKNGQFAVIADIVVACVAAALAMTIGIVVARSILNQLGGEPADVVEQAERIASGDLSGSMVNLNARHGSVMNAMQRMQENLIKVISMVRTASEGVASASGQVAVGNSDLSARTEEQASALEETAASMEQLNATVQQNSAASRQASDLVNQVAAMAKESGETFKHLVVTMGGIDDSSRKIAEIIGVIDGIAFQTNILALNAAVEAARAGDAGRGFAVVASEVRNLASRSADAAKEVRALITASVDQAKHGSTQITNAAGTIDQLVQSIQIASQLMAEISASSSEQASGVEQVGEAVVQMDQTTQQNAALVEQMAAAADSMSTQAKELVRAVSSFRLSSVDPVLR